MNERPHRFNLLLGGPLDRRPGDARRWVTARCAALDIDGTDAGLNLLVSELVTNACLHGGDPMTLGLELNSSRVRVEVADSVPDWPSVQSPSDRDPGGRGLLIVDSVSSVWGVERSTAGGKVVWAEVAIKKPGDETLEKVGRL